MDQSVNAAIQANRTADVELTLRDAAGRLLVGQTVLVEQTRHKFLFGVAGFDIVTAENETDPVLHERASRRVEKITALFNAVTLPFYWARFEPSRGQPMTQQLLKGARWAVEHGLVVKGHPLCWHTLAPDWLLPLSNAAILETQLARIRRDVSDFSSGIQMWDVLNEGVIMPVFDKYDNGLTRVCKELGRIETIRRVFAEARATNPQATLLLNDFDMSPAYDILVEGCLEAGIPIDVIGIQSHMHQGYWGVDKTQRILENFSRFNLPIHFTETTIISGDLMPPEIVDLNDYQVSEWPSTPAGEERQVQEVLLHYQTLLAQPLVEGLTWWDLADGGWLHAPAGLIRQDASAKPVYEELLKLIKGEWWLAPTHLTTDAEGKIRFHGWLGDYSVQVGSSREAFSVKKRGSSQVEVRLK